MAAPQRVLLEQALAYRSTGTSLPHSSAFRDLLPANGYTDCSALLYRNLTGVATAVAGGLFQPPQPEAAALLSELAEPSLVCVFGEERRLVLSGTGGSLLGALPLLGMPGVMQPPTAGANQSTAVGVSSAG